jgi:hypothetical protein
MSKVLCDTAASLKAGDVIEVQRLTRADHTGRVRYDSIIRDTFTARVYSVKVEAGLVSVSYVPCNRPDSIRCIYGWTVIAPVADDNHRPGCWGWQSIRVLGSEQAAQQWSANQPFPFWGEDQA